VQKRSERYAIVLRIGGFDDVTRRKAILMRYFMICLTVKDYESARSTLIDFKQKIKEQGEITVFECEESNYDFLYNTLSERANTESKRR
jgi:hypothetical protein